MTAAQNTTQWQGSRRMQGPLAIAAAGLMIAVVGIAISARPVAAPASVAGNGSVPLTLGHDEHATSLGAKSVPLTLGHDEHATSAGPGSAPLTSGHDEHVQSQPRIVPTAPLAPRGGGSRFV